MNKLDAIGKYLFALPFGVFGVFHFMSAEAMAGMVPSFLPFAEVWVYLTGAALLAACIAILWGKMAQLAATLLGVLLLVYVLTIHLPAVMGGDQSAMPSVLKDLALAGGAFYFAGKQGSCV